MMKRKEDRSILSAKRQKTSNLWSVIGRLSLNAMFNDLHSHVFLAHNPDLIVAETASRRGTQLTFWEYTKSGIIITVITLAIGVLWIQLFIWK